MDLDMWIFFRIFRVVGWEIVLRSLKNKLKIVAILFGSLDYFSYVSTVDVGMFPR